ncbi:SMC-Scp complex subunit ScpB [Aquisalimonas sp.]|uniref:SMC-Scp complex subunit ScpB n=1 Tax=Aquisalimonas sp. TaxID=1872621 RepID=UPI0025BF75F2|nr:SMC-Scp complex subunit ScpB [Aquisalimonas sp.]
MAEPGLKQILEAALLTAGAPLSLEHMQSLFDADTMPDKATLRASLVELANDYAARAVELREVASGYRIQVRAEFAPWVSKLWEEKPQRYSRALLETLAIIAYRQPVTRGEIEDIRGVSVNTNIMRTLQERGWVRSLGHRDVPGRPAMYGTTRQFLDYFNLASLGELPSLLELHEMHDLRPELPGKIQEQAEEGAQAFAATPGTESDRG